MNLPSSAPFLTLTVRPSTSLPASCTGEYLGRLHLNVNRKPQFRVRNVLRDASLDPDPAGEAAVTDGRASP